MKFRVVLHPEPDGGYVATCPALPGCVSQGDDRDEALTNIREAIEGVLAVLNARAAVATPGDQVVDVEV